MKFLQSEGLDSLEIIERCLSDKKRAVDYVTKIKMPFEMSYTAEQLFAIVTTSLGDASIEPDEYNESIVKNLCCYFTNDKRGNLDTSKGIMLLGPIGVGKTHIMKAFSSNPNQGFIVKSVKSVVSEFMENGSSVVDKHSNIYVGVAMNKLTGKNSMSWCFDDIGIEENANSFGNVRNVMLDILERCYERKTIVHVTGNLTIEQMADRYGVRLLDRFKEMFNIVHYEQDAKSKRH